MPVPAKNTKASGDEHVFLGHYVTLAEAKAILEREQAEREELTYEQRLSLDHTSYFVRMPKDVSKELRGKLEELGLTAMQATKIADLAPTHEDDVRAVFAKDRMTPDAEVIQKIIDLVLEYQ